MSREIELGFHCTVLLCKIIFIMLIISHENIFQLFAFLDLREDKPIRTDSGLVFAEPEEPIFTIL